MPGACRSNIGKIKDFGRAISLHMLLWQHKGCPCGANLCHFQIKDKYLTEAVSMDINPNAKFNICYKRMMFVKHGGIDSFRGILRMTSVRILHMLFL